MSAWHALTAATALACAAGAGALSTYSGFTTRALAQLPPGQGMAAMQQVNAAAPRSAPFMALLLAPGAAALVLLARAAVDRSAPGAALAAGGSLLHLLGVVGTTVVVHVPRNDALAALDAATEHDGWHEWLDGWVRANHVRTVSGFVASGLLALSLG